MAPIFTPQDYINAIRLFTNKYCLVPEGRECELGQGELEFPLEWLYEDQCFQSIGGKIQTPEDAKLFSTIARHWKRMDRSTQINCYKEMCGILNIDYEEDDDDNNEEDDDDNNEE